MNLVYDRTAQDVETARTQRGTTLTPLKGCYNIADLNRVESAVKTLAAALTSAGYPAAVTPVLKGGSRLPAGYTEVEWIQSSRTQYIDTGFKPNQETKMSLKMAFLGAAGENVAGTRNSSNDTANRFGIVTFGSASKIGAMFRGTATQGIPVDTATHSYTLSKSGLTVDGASYGGADSGTFACTYPVILCGWNNGSNGIAPNKSRIVSCDIYAGGVLARQFVPCKNPAGTVGLYDLVGGEFYTTPTAVPLPAGYTQVEYLKSTGTQYINVGFKPNQDTRIVLDVNSPLVSGPVWLFGARTAADSKTYNFLCQSSKYRSDYNDNSSTSLTINPSGRFEIDKDKNITKINGSTASTIPYGAFQCEYSLYLFSNNNAGATGAGASISIYSCKIYDNGTLVRDLIPARNSSGTLGLYDTVDGTFYTNQGSGAFTAGADIVGFTAGAEIGKAEDREWQEGDIVRRAQWSTYLDNVQRLRDAYYTLADTGELPKPEDKLGYVGANNIEKVLADIDLLLDGMKSSYRRCGTFRTGNNAAHLPLKGSV